MEFIFGNKMQIASYLLSVFLKGKMTESIILRAKGYKGLRIAILFIRDFRSIEKRDNFLNYNNSVTS